MFTDPKKARKDDPGHPESCVAHAFFKVYDPEGSKNLTSECKKGGRGCVDCKKKLAAILNEVMGPVREKRAEIDKRGDFVNKMIKQGNERAAKSAAKTMKRVRKLMIKGQAEV